jgi:sn-glycerol 3-phosphate transport system permease protein
MPSEKSPPAALGERDAPETAINGGRRRLRRQGGWRTVRTYLLLSVLTLIVLIPLYITVVNSLLQPNLIAHQPPPLFPLHPQWSSYSTAWSEGDLGLYLRNSAIATAIIVSGQLLTTVFAAYSFAFLRFPFKRTLFIVFLSTMMIPFEVTLVTNLTTITDLGWYNTFAGLTVPFLATGFGTFLLRQAFLQLPRDLREAAKLDGYGHVRYLLRIALPLARPTVAALAVFSFLGAWNQYLWPLVVTGDNNAIRTVQIGLKQLQATQANQVNVTLAGTIIAAAPLLVLLIVFQKQLVRGLTAGAVK